MWNPACWALLERKGKERRVVFAARIVPTGEDGEHGGGWVFLRSDIPNACLVLFGAHRGLGESESSLARRTMLCARRDTVS